MYQQMVIEQQPALRLIAIKASDFFSMSGDNDIVQHFIPTNKLGPQ